MDWYIIQTKSNAHLTASKHLKNQNFEVFLPLILKTLKKRGKFINITIPLFPSYLFIGTRDSKVPWKSINSTRGVSKAVTLDGTYRAVMSKIVEGLKQRCDASGVIKKGTQILSGDQAKIEKGPFTDFICQVENIADNHRVWVLMDIMHQKTKTQISINDLSKIH